MRVTISTIRPKRPVAPCLDAIGVARIYGNFDPFARMPEERFAAPYDRDILHRGECVHAACSPVP